MSRLEKDWGRRHLPSCDHTVIILIFKPCAILVRARLLSGLPCNRRNQRPRAHQRRRDAWAGHRRPLRFNLVGRPGCRDGLKEGHARVVVKLREVGNGEARVRKRTVVARILPAKQPSASLGSTESGEDCADVRPSLACGKSSMDTITNDDGLLRASATLAIHGTRNSWRCAVPRQGGISGNTLVRRIICVE